MMRINGKFIQCTEMSVKRLTIKQCKNTTRCEQEQNDTNELRSDRNNKKQEYKATYKVKQFG